MARTGRQRWGRALVVLTLPLGVVAMHSRVMPMGAGDAMPSATVATAALDPVPEVAAGSGVAAGSADSATGAMTDLCLAVLAALTVLGLGAIAFVLRAGRAGEHRPFLVRVAALWPRPPHPPPSGSSDPACCGPDRSALGRTSRRHHHHAHREHRDPPRG